MPCDALLDVAPCMKSVTALAYSSGSHAQMFALASRILGVIFHVVIPFYAPGVKKEVASDYGAVIEGCTLTLEAKGGEEGDN